MRADVNQSVDVNISIRYVFQIHIFLQILITYAANDSKRDSIVMSRKQVDLKCMFATYAATQGHLIKH